jgi:hypothetical protein
VRLVQVRQGATLSRDVTNVGDPGRLPALRLEVAARAGVDPCDVARSLLVRYRPQDARRGLDPIAAFGADDPRRGFIHPSRRIKIAAPKVPAARLAPPPAGLVLERTPRDARRPRDSRAATAM